MAITLQFEGKANTIDMDEITSSQAKTIESCTGLNLIELQAGIQNAKADALIATYWLMRVQNGDPGCDIKSVDFKIVQFTNALVEAATALSEQAETQQPKVKANTTGKTRSRPRNIEAVAAL